MTLVREQESAEAIVPGATSRKTKPDGLTTREGLNLAGRHDHRGSCSGSDEADWPSYRQRPSWQRKSAASFRKDCQEPPYADPHVRWCGRREGKLSRRPDWHSCSLGLSVLFRWQSLKLHTSTVIRIAHRQVNLVRWLLSNQHHLGVETSRFML